MLNSHSNSVRTAMIMLKRHGLQASAVAQEREVMARLVPDVEGVDFWYSVQRSISELRGTPRWSDPGQTRKRLAFA
jgi:hypothetical protein